MYVSPMLLGKTQSPFEDDGFITELKLDGFRMTLSKWDGKVRLYTRHKNEVTSKFKELLNINLPNGTILDGEVVVSDENGKPDFEAVMERFQSSKSIHSIQYLVFDIIYYKGEKVTHLPLLERKELLQEIMPSHPFIFQTQWIVGNAPAYFELVQQQGLEGIVQKKIDSKYFINKRSDVWLKCINYQYENVVVTGYRKNEFGLLLGMEEEGTIRNVGMMEFVPVGERHLFYQKAKWLKTGENKDFVFIEPTIACKVKFRNWTKAHKLRIPSFCEYTA